MRIFNFFITIIVISLFFHNSFAGEVKTGTLKNKFSYLIQRESSSPLVVLQLWIARGSVHESDNEAGLAHFLEHLTFRSKNIAQRVEDLGGEINAYTTYDRTVYYLTVPAEHWLNGMAVLKDIYDSTAFDETTFEKEKKVIIDEMKRGRDNPRKMAYELFFKTAITTHPIKRPVIGHETNIGKTSLLQVKKFYDRFYSPDAAFLLIVGDIDEAKAAQKIRELFSGKKPIAVTPAQLNEPQRDKPSIAAKKMKINSCYLTLGVPTAAIDSEDSPAIDVFSYILGESSTSLLNQKLKEEKQLVNYVYAYNMALKDVGQYVISANMECKNLEPAIKEMFSMLSKNDLTISDNDLKKVLVNYESNYYFSRERFPDIASDIGSSFFYFHDPDYSKKHITAIKKISRADLERVKNKYFKLERLTTTVLIPESGDEENVKGFIENELRSVSAKKEGLQSIVLKNGVRLFINKRSHNPTFAITMVTLTGSRNEDLHTQGLTNFTISSILRGTKTYSYKDILDKIEGMGGSLSGYSTKNLAGLKGKFLTQNFEEAIALTSEIINNFSPNEEEIEKVRNLILAEIDRKKESPTKLLKDLFFATAYPGSSLGFPTEGTAGSITGMKKKQIMEHFRAIFTPEKLIVVISGDVPNNAEKILDKYLGTMPSGKRVTEKILSVPSPAKYAVAKYDFEQSHILVGFPVPGIVSSQRPYFQLLSVILSNQSGRLFVNLRDKEGLAYALGAFLYESPEQSLFNLYIATSPENAQRARDGLFGEIHTMLEEGITDEELSKAKNQIRTEILQMLQENQDIASTFANNALFFEDPQHHKEYERIIKEITTEEFLNTIRTFLDPKNAVTVIVEGKESAKH